MARNFSLLFRTSVVGGRSLAVDGTTSVDENTGKTIISVDSIWLDLNALSDPDAPVNPNTVPVFTLLPSLSGNNLLGSIITIDTGQASGLPAPVITAVLTRPGKLPVQVADGDTFVLEAADQGGTIILDAAAANIEGSASASAQFAVPAAVVPTVANVQNGGYSGTTPTVAADGTVTITNVASEITGEHGVSHYFVRADNMEGKTLKVRRSAGSPNDIGGNMSAWQMAWAYDPEGEWSAFDTVVNSSGVIVATENSPMAQPTVYIARRPVFTNDRWDQAIARWKANPLTSPTASGDADFIIGTLPENSYAPEMAAYGFKFGAGPDVITISGNIHVEEHIAAYAYEAFVDWLLGSDPKAAYLRTKCTFYCYPKINPQSRYAGASRQEVVSGENANRIFSSGYNHIPLSQLMRNVWEVDLPATIAGAIDFHDVPPATRASELFWSGDASMKDKVVAIHKARTGRDVVVNASGTTPGTITDYMRTMFLTSWTVTPEHGIINNLNVPDWKAWGLDFAEALYQHYQAPPVQNDWIEPDWLPAVPTSTTAVENADGSVTVTNPNGNPGASFRIPDGKNIEVIIDLTQNNTNMIFLRQSAVQALSVAQSTELHKTGQSTSPFYLVQQVTWDATKPYFGVFAARANTANPASIVLKPTVKYRILNP